MIERLAPSITQKHGDPKKFVQTPMDKHYIPRQGYKNCQKTTSEFQNDTINRCLTDDCKDCTGSYSNDLLRHRLTCLCQCHRKIKTGTTDRELQSTDYKNY